MFIKKIAIAAMLLSVLGIPAPSAAAPPAMTTVTAPPAAPSPAAAPPSPDACICLHHPATDNVIRNCTRQQRQNDPQPRFLCADADGIKQEQENVQDWTVLPADDADCAPCQDNGANPPGGIPRGGDES